MAVRWVRSVACVFTVAVLAGRVAATTCQDICPGTGNCTITGGPVITPGSVVDCSGRNITISGYGHIDVVNGSFTLKANNLTMGAGRNITASRNTGSVPFGMVIQLTGTLSMDGRLVASSNWGGGFVRVETAGDALMPYGGGDTIVADGTSTDAPGGTIEVYSGRHIVIGELMSAKGANNTNSVADGGSISLTAAGNITITGEINVYGPRSDAGTILLTALGIVDAAGGPLAQPDSVLCTNPNRTGRIETSLSGQLLAEGGYNEGNGGQIYLAAPEIVIGAPVSAQGGLFVTGGLSSGGSVVFEAGRCGVQINNDINVTSGEGGAGQMGGSIVAAAGGLLVNSNGDPISRMGDITVGSGKVLKTKSDANGGDGGGIVLNAVGAVTLGTNALLDARGHESGGGQGAAVTLLGCDVTVNSGAQIDARGYDGGSILLTSRRNLIVIGGTTARLKATGLTASGGTNGSIALRHSRGGRCSNNPSVACRVATCVNQACSDMPSQQCTSNGDCSGCGAATCLANPDTGGTTAQFSPAPPTYDLNVNLEVCP